MRELLPMPSGLRSCAKSSILDLIWQMTSCCMMPSTVECMFWVENADKVNAECVGIRMHLEYARPVLFAWNTWFWYAFVKSDARACYCMLLHVVCAKAALGESIWSICPAYAGHQ